MFESWEQELEPNSERVQNHPGIKNLTNAKLWLLVSFLIKGFKASSIPLVQLRVYCQEAVCDYLVDHHPNKVFTDKAVRDLLDEASGNSTPTSHPTSPASINLFDDSPAEQSETRTNAEVSLINNLSLIKPPSDSTPKYSFLQYRDSGLGQTLENNESPYLSANEDNADLLNKSQNSEKPFLNSPIPVSYTHLTLPTIYSV